MDLDHPKTDRRINKNLMEPKRSINQTIFAYALVQ